mmetsp:Transcript_19951/g.43523  ORF Transcript_19951/g.43523 Transcript_19951/m.43523 type:complete len:237 (-) Transcript_19951:1339-2049(-)
MHRTPRPPGSSQPQTKMSIEPARGSLASSSWEGLNISRPSVLIGEAASSSGSSMDCRGVHANFTVMKLVGMRVGRSTCSRSSEPPFTGAQVGSTWLGPSFGQRQYQSTVAVLLGVLPIRVVASKSFFKSLRLPCRFLDERNDFSEPFNLSVLSVTGCTAERSRVQVNPSSIETWRSTAAVRPCSTAVPRGERVTSGVQNSTVSSAMIRPTTTVSQRGALDLSLTLTGIDSWSRGAL